MLLPTDPDTLRVPAFMRSRSLRSRMKRPLVLTALDRKQAGIPPEGLQKKRRKMPIQKPLIDTRPRRDVACHVPTKKSVFSEPIVDFAPVPAPARMRTPPSRASEAEPTNKPKKMGIITHYYSKIQVAVMKVSASVSVGDLVTYETADGESYEQIIESMEIEREPVFSARKGQEVGLKLRREPRVGCQILSL